MTSYCAGRLAQCASAMVAAPGSEGLPRNVMVLTSAKTSFQRGKCAIGTIASVSCALVSVSPGIERPARRSAHAPEASGVNNQCVAATLGSTVLSFPLVLPDTGPASAPDWTAAVSLRAVSATYGATMAALGTSARAACCSGYHIPSEGCASPALEPISRSNKELDQSDEENSRSTIAVTPMRQGTHPSVIDRACTGIENRLSLIGARR